MSVTFMIESVSGWPVTVSYLETLNTSPLGTFLIFQFPTPPILRCLYPSPSLLEGCRSCANAGVLGPVPGLIGSSSFSYFFLSFTSFFFSLLPRFFPPFSPLSPPFFLLLFILFHSGASATISDSFYSQLLSMFSFYRFFISCFCYSYFFFLLLFCQFCFSSQFSGCLQAVEVIKVLLSGTVISDITRELHRHREQSQKIPNNADNTDSLTIDDDHKDKKARPDRPDRPLRNSQTTSPLIGRQIFYDAAAGEFHNFILPPRNPSCAVCGVGPSIRCMEGTRESLSASAQRMKEVRLNSF